MKILIMSAVLASAAAVACQVPAAEQPKPPVLENTRWHVTATPATGKKMDADTKLVDALLFRSGTVASSVQARKGFAASAYTITPKDGKWELSVRQAKAKVGEVTWSCEIAADKFSGTMVCKHTDGTVESFKLNGVRAPDIETTSWKIKVTDTSDSKATPVEDTLLFLGHKMTSKELRAKGFVMCAFNLVPEEGGGWALEAEQHNKTDKSHLVWSGELKGDTIKGTITMFDADGGTKSESKFEGVKTNKHVRAKKSGSKRKKGNKKK